MATSSVVNIQLKIDYGAVDKELSSMTSKLKGLVSGSFSKLGGVIASSFDPKKITAFGKTAIQLASNLQEIQNVVDVTFGSMSSEINNWSKDLVANFGLSEGSAKKYSSQMGTC